MKTKLTLINLLIFVNIVFGQYGDYIQYSENKIKDFYINLNSYADKSYDDDDRKQFRSEIEDNFLKQNQSILVNNLSNNGSDQLTSTDYLNALYSWFPYEQKTKFEISNVVADIPKIKKGYILCKVYYTLHFTGLFTNKKQIESTNNMIAFVEIPDNDLSKAFISKIAYSNKKELKKISNLVKQRLQMEKEWEKIKNTADKEKIRNYINKYPNSFYRSIAEERYKELEKNSVKNIEKEHWILAKEQNTIEKYKEFINKYPYGNHVDDARKAISDLEHLAKVNQDNNDWHIAKSKNTINSYSDYLKTHEFGLHIDEAKKKIKKLNASNIYDDLGYEKKLGGAGSALYSMLFPGWGDYKVHKGKAPYFIIGIAALGLSGGGGYFYNQYKTNKDLYLNATDQNEIKKYKDKYTSQYKTSVIMLGVGGAIWLTDIILVAIKGSKNSKEYMYKKHSYSSFGSYDYKSNSASLGLRVLF